MTGSQDQRPSIEKGQALAEYGMIIAIVAVASIAALFFLGWAIDGPIGDLINKIF